ncbi:MAG: DUF4019 domain-containing protein [Thermodesulfovibrionia bacterium]|nr:DUF4019 domain-containing protein [Thermodesulfovibrionia bacterium]
MYRYIAICFAIFGILTSNTVLAEDVSVEKSAVTAAESWLRLVDGGQYSESWEQAAEYFRAIMKQQAWEDSIRPLRESLGKVVTRTLKAQQYTTTMPGAPDGEYVVVQFETFFENKKFAVETVTPMVDEDGVWRVSGYYIK